MDINVLIIFHWNFFLRKSHLKHTFCVIDQIRITSVVADFPIIFIICRNCKKFVSRTKCNFSKESRKENFLYPLFRSLMKNFRFIFKKIFSSVLKRTYLVNSPRMKLFMVCFWCPLVAGIYMYLFTSF